MKLFSQFCLTLAVVASLAAFPANREVLAASVPDVTLNVQNAGSAPSGRYYAASRGSRLCRSLAGDGRSARPQPG